MYFYVMPVMTVVMQSIMLLHYITVITDVVRSIMLPERNVPIESLGDLANAMQENIRHLYL